MYIIIIIIVCIFVYVLYVCVGLCKFIIIYVCNLMCVIDVHACNFFISALPQLGLVHEELPAFCGEGG